MKKIITYKINIFATKLLTQILKIFNIGSGTNLPGRFARKINPEILSYLVNQTKKEIIVVTGTNGKTTTTGLIASILKNDGRKLAHNRKGANMLAGITTAIINSTDILGNFNSDNSLLEMDEAYFYKAVDEFLPNIVLVTNLFRDQLDRYGELDTTRQKIQQAIDKITEKQNLKVILNADDPMVSTIDAKSNIEKVFFGFNEITFKDMLENIDEPMEIAACRQCGEKLNYQKTFYGHLGHYNCNCGYKRPEVQIQATAEINSTSSILNINAADKNLAFKVKVNMPGIYNAYNALAAIAMAIELNISTETIINGFNSYDTVFGRAEILNLKNIPVLIQLIKNPIGATEVIRTVKADENARLLIIINDNYADGRDVSWLWDAGFEMLADHKFEIITSGIRAADMAVRLKYAGVPQENITIIDNIEKALEYSLSATQKEQKLYILPTYTALLKLQYILKKY